MRYISNIYNQLWVLYTGYNSHSQVTKTLYNPTEQLPDTPIFADTRYIYRIFRIYFTAS